MKLRNGNLCLVGFMGTGKDKVGKILATQLGATFVNTDELIKESFGNDSIQEIFRLKGEAEFRSTEMEVLRRVCTQSAQLISTGGGSFAQTGEVGDRLRSTMLECATVCWLDVSLPIIRKRLAKKADDRPLAKDPVAMEKLFWQRRPLYGKAHIIVRIDVELPAEEVATRVVHAIARQKAA